MSPLKETVLANDIKPKAETSENADTDDSNHSATPTKMRGSADSSPENEEEEDDETGSSEGEEIDDDFLARELAEELG